MAWCFKDLCGWVRWFRMGGESFDSGSDRGLDLMKIELVVKGLIWMSSDM